MDDYEFDYTISGSISIDIRDLIEDNVEIWDKLKADTPQAKLEKFIEYLWNHEEHYFLELAWDDAETVDPTMERDNMTALLDYFHDVVAGRAGDYLRGEMSSLDEAQWALRYYATRSKE